MRGQPEPAGTRRLWMYTMPGLTESVFLAACRAVGLSQRHMDGRTIYASKVGDVQPESWTALRVECERLLGLPKDWESKRIDSYYEEWVKRARPLWGIKRRTADKSGAER